MKNFIVLVFFVLSFILINGCDERPESPVKGSLVVYADESIFPVVKIQVDTFLVLYPDAKIDLIKLSAREGIAKMINDKAELFISSREFNEEEHQAVIQNKLDIKTMKFCYDGIAAITSYETQLENISFEQLQDLLNGKFTQVTTVVPGKNSGVYEYLSKEILNGSELNNSEVVQSESEVIEIVKSSINKIGFVGFNLLNDSSQVRILNLGLRVQGGLQDSYLEPHPGYFVQRLYPLSRTCVIFLNEVNIGLASGFATFLTGNDGQKIVLENNLGPAAVPVKVVQ